MTHLFSVFSEACYPLPADSHGHLSAVMAAPVYKGHFTWLLFPGAAEMETSKV